MYLILKSIGVALLVLILGPLIVILNLPEWLVDMFLDANPIFKELGIIALIVLSSVVGTLYYKENE